MRLIVAWSRVYLTVTIWVKSRSPWRRDQSCFLISYEYGHAYCSEQLGSSRLARVLGATVRVER